MLELERTVDILAHLGADKGCRLLVGFAAETREVVEAAKGKLATKGLDLVVANDVSSPELGFGTDANRVWLVSADDVVELPVLTKRAIARALWDRLAPQASDAATRRMAQGEDAR